MHDYMRIRLQAMAATERGASAVEYGLLVALIAIAIIVGVTALGGKLNAIFDSTSTTAALIPTRERMHDGGLESETRGRRRLRKGMNDTPVTAQTVR